ncbi:MAG: PspC domain-containing protein [Oscillospiraceae bacterium]
MQQKLTRSRHDRKLLGVCGGLAAFFGIDATLIRLIWALGTLFSVGLGLVAYLVAALIIPEEPLL